MREMFQKCRKTCFRACTEQTTRSRCLIVNQKMTTGSSLLLSLQLFTISRTFFLISFTSYRVQTSEYYYGTSITKVSETAALRLTLAGSHSQTLGTLRSTTATSMVTGLYPSYNHVQLGLTSELSGERQRANRKYANFNVQFTNEPQCFFMFKIQAQPERFLT